MKNQMRLTLAMWSLVGGLTATAFSAVPGNAPPRLSTNALINADAPENRELKRFLEASETSKSLVGKRIAVLTTDGVEDIEIAVPFRWLRAQGAQVELVAPKLPELPAKFGVVYPAKRATHILTVAFMQNRNWLKIDRFLEDAKPGDYDAVIVAGGAWNPDSLRNDPNALRFIREMFNARKITAAICHGPQVFISAGITRGKKATGVWNMQLDLKNSGADVLDQPVVVDGNLVTSRVPYDLPQFLRAVRDALAHS